MRNEMIGAVVRRAIEHPEFRQRLVENPQEALSAHGFVLESTTSPKSRASAPNSARMMPSSNSSRLRNTTA